MIHSKKLVMKTQLLLIAVLLALSYLIGKGSVEKCSTEVFQKIDVLTPNANFA